MTALRLLVTGRQGQVVRALSALAAADETVDVVTTGRPEMDLERLETIAAAIAAARPDVVVNAAAYTAVDRAESEKERAFAVNAAGAGAVAAAAAALGLPVIQISTDYVFDGSKATPYVETDATAPLSVYGASKLAGEQAVAAANPKHAILRTAWVYSAGGANFLLSMLRLARERPMLRIVDDQHGSPTHAADIAAGIVTVARRLATGAGATGLFHMTAGGETTWCGFARAILATSSRIGGPSVPVEPITTADYPTPAVRPRNSRLECSKIAAAYGIQLPDWRARVESCVAVALAA
jgi:dTDP-4-dehydrorhamnose reductase